MYAMTLQAYFLNIDTSTTFQITTAPTMKQAEEVMAPFRTAISRAPGPLFQFLTDGGLRNSAIKSFDQKKLASTKKGIQNFLTDSILEIRPMSVTKLQGLRPKCSTVDEWLSGDIREDVIGALEQGANKVKDWAIIAISSEGTVRNGAGDTIKMELATILRGEYIAPHISIWHYKLDRVEEVANPAMWAKAQPNIGITVSYEAYHRDVERAEKAPATRNDILAKRFGIPMEGYTYFFPYQETIPRPRRQFWNMPCSLGADLSQGDDFCAFTFMFPLPGDILGVKTYCYITEATMVKLPGARRFKYDTFIAEGSLRVLPGVVLDLDDVFDDLDKIIADNGYDVRTFGYDPYNAREFVARWERENGPYGIEKVIQGARTESVPLGEIKKLSEIGALYFDQDLFSFGMGNAITLEDTNGNRKLWKKRQDQKIDPIAALVDAYVAYKLHKEAFE